MGSAGTSDAREVNCYTLLVRQGKPGGGKGALIQTNKSATLSCTNNQTLFVPKVYGWHSQSTTVTQEPLDKFPTLVAAMGEGGQT